MTNLPEPQPFTGFVSMIELETGVWHASWQTHPDEPDGYLRGPEGMTFDQALEWARSQPARRVIIQNNPPDPI